MLRVFPMECGQLGQTPLHLTQPVIDTVNMIAHPPEILSQRSDYLVDDQGEQAHQNCLDDQGQCGLHTDYPTINIC